MEFLRKSQFFWKRPIKSVSFFALEIGGDGKTGAKVKEGRRTEGKKGTDSRRERKR